MSADPHLTPATTDESPPLVKSLELQGYKTFASRTLFEFGRTITAIVGPNGSGKSNIADSIRWVLGEQSYSLLRGKKTEDMIFAGSEARPRASMASATITFDNSSGWLPIDFSEVSISRRAYRDGQNEYLINGQRVRLREVSELLAQVGLAERTYTIIGQGLVDAALSLKAEERRKLFEEAAGIGLYRSRREEALRRLETTRHNLERVQDILAELRPRLRSLERQAQRAREYDQVKTDLEAALRLWYGYHWHHLSRLVADARAQATRNTESRDRLRQALEAAEQQLSTTRSRIDRLRAEMHGSSQTVSNLYAQREVLGTRVAVSQERLRWLGEQARQAEVELGELEPVLQTTRERMAAVQREVELRRQDLEAVEGAAGWAAEGALEGQAPLDRLEEAGRALQELAARRAVWEATSAETANRLKGTEAQSEEAARSLEAARLAARQAEEGHGEAERRALEAMAQREHAQSAESEARQVAAAIEVDLQRINDRATAVRSRVAGAEARMEMVARQSREEEEALNRLHAASAEGRLGGLVGRLNQQLRVPAELDAAISGALGEFLSGVTLRTAEDVEAMLAWLDGEDGHKPGALLPLAALRRLPPRLTGEGPDCLGNAADLVHAEALLQPVIDALLGRTLVVRDRKAARRMLPELPEDARLVTLAGEVFHPAGHVLLGGGGRRPVAHRDARERLEQDLSRARAELQSAEAETRRKNDELAAARGRLQEAQRAAEAAGAAEREAMRKLSAADAQRLARVREVQLLEVRVGELEGEAARLTAEGSRAADLQASFDEELTRLEGVKRAAGEAVRAAHAGDAGARDAELRARIEAARTAQEAARSREAELAERVATIERDLQARRSRLAQSREEQGRLNREVAEGGPAMRALEEKLAEVAAQIKPMEQSVAEAEAQRTELEAAQSQARTQLQVAERDHSQSQIELARRQEEMNSLKRRIDDDFGLVAFEFDEETTIQTPLPLEGLVERLPVIETLPLEVESQVDRLRTQLRRMGAINPEAQREYAEVRERVEFLTGQVADSRAAETQLQEVIAELDLLMEREFRKTFDAVAVAFREAFTRLFGGGSARLRLTDPDDLTSTGIDIEARLPGRREQGLAMLSGGERSLTASALVFALMKVSPTPVCVLDEVDAMLDEANVVRFREMLQELSQQTQFIVITHNRETIQAAEVVYGVTMGRDTASTVISLKLEEAARKIVR